MRIKWKNKLVIIILAAACVVCAINPLSAQAETEEYWPDMPDVNSPSVIVMEVNTGTVLYEKDSHAQNYPASITKIMTTLLAIENCSLDETVVFSYDAVYGGNEGDTSHIARDYLEELTLEQCLYAVMLESANECAYAVAEHVGESLGGDYSTFIDLMNEKASKLGCTDTHFNNSNGLPDTEHWTSAYDMALIAAEAYKNETFRTITSTTSYTIPATNKHDDPYYCHNHHKMLYAWKGDDSYLYDYCTGGKTGYTSVAGNTLVSFAEKDGITLVCVVMQAQTSYHYIDTRTLFDYCFDNFQVFNISENETTITNEAMESAGILNNNGSFVSLDEDAYIILPKSAEFSDAQYTLDVSGTDGTIARLSYTYAGKTVGSASIVTTGVTAEETPFETAEETETSDIKVVRVNPLMIFLVILAVAAVGVLIFFGKRLFENFYIIRHNWSAKLEQKSRFREIRKKKRKWRKKDRWFK